MRRCAPLLLLVSACASRSPVDPGDEGPLGRDAGHGPIDLPGDRHRCSGDGDETTLFLDVTSCAGITSTHEYEQDYQTNGQAFSDFDQDGWLDLYVTNTHGFNTLYRNNGDGTFSIPPQFGDVTEDFSLSGGAIFGDYNNDGWPDLYVLNQGRNTLYRNDRGRRFVDVTDTAGVGDEGRGQTAAWGDFDGDGDIDLYVTNWFCPECGDGMSLEPNKDRLYRNEGNGTFSDVSHVLGDFERTGGGYVASFFDYDDDNDLDIYVVNDKGYEGDPHEGAPMNRNLLYENQGPGCAAWCFVERGIEAGADARLDGMGLAIGDYDGDLDLDMFFTNIGVPVLLRNRGDRTFEDITEIAGVGYDHESWGAEFLDIDNDGWLDLHYVLGIAFGFESPNRTYRNRGDGTFEDVSDVSGADHAAYTIGLATGDYDNDGAVDIVIGDWARGYRLYKNLAHLHADHHWLSIRLVGAGPVNRDAIGARVTLETSDGRRLMQEVKSGSSNGSGSDTRLHFGLGTATVERMHVRWPDGTTETIEDVPVRERIEHHYPG